MLPDVVGNSFPNKPIETVPSGRTVKPGVQVGWVGFPYMVNTNRPCFFSGYVSAYVNGRYFIDGVAIPGVSGGPAFLNSHNDDPPDINILGSITAYTPARAGHEVIPGLMVADNCAYWHDVVKHLKKQRKGKKSA